jgi:hypothetical protein
MDEAKSNQFSFLDELDSKHLLYPNYPNYGFERTANAILHYVRIVFAKKLGDSYEILSDPSVSQIDIIRWKFNPLAPIPSFAEPRLIRFRSADRTWIRTFVTKHVLAFDGETVESRLQQEVEAIVSALLQQRQADPLETYRFLGVLDYRLECTESVSYLLLRFRYTDAIAKS